MPRVILSGHIVIPRHDLELVLAELPTHIDLTRKEPGCLAFEVNQDAEIPHVFHVYEEFLDRNAFDAHQWRVKSSTWGHVASGVERHYDIKDGG